MPEVLLLSILHHLHPCQLLPWCPSRHGARRLSTLCLSNPWRCCWCVQLACETHQPHAVLAEASKSLPRALPFPYKNSLRWQWCPHSSSGQWDHAQFLLVKSRQPCLLWGTELWSTNSACLCCQITSIVDAQMRAGEMARGVKHLLQAWGPEFRYPEHMSKPDTVAGLSTTLGQGGRRGTESPGALGPASLVYWAG